MTILINGVDAGVSYSGTGGSIAYAATSGTLGSVTGLVLTGQMAYAFLKNADITITGINELMRHPFAWDAVGACWPLHDPTGSAFDRCAAGINGSVGGSVAASSDGPPVYLTSPLAWHRLWRRLVDWTLPSAWADDVIVYDPADATVPNRVTSYQRNVDIVKSGAVSNPNTLIYSSPIINSPRPWDGTVPPVAQQYWKRNGASVVEMTPAEKTAVDAPAVADAALQASYTSEVLTNDLCDATLADITARIETRRTTLRTQVESQRVTNNTTITNAANNIAGLKTAMTTLNNVQATEFNASVDELASLATKVAKCVRARAR